MAFLCNLFFVMCLILQRMPHNLVDNPLTKYIVVLGWLLSFILNFIVNIWWLITYISKLSKPYLKWLFVTNTLFFLFQILYYMLLC
jgi:hypothetical protein